MTPADPEDPMHRTERETVGVRFESGQRLSGMDNKTTGGVYDSGLDRIYVLEGAWGDGVLNQFWLCDCGKWDAMGCTMDGSRIEWLIYFRDRCSCPEHYALFDLLWERQHDGDPIEADLAAADQG
jgi:hypothetical protein